MISPSYIHVGQRDALIHSAYPQDRAYTRRSSGCTGAEQGPTANQVRPLLGLTAGEEEAEEEERVLTVFNPNFFKLM